MKRKKKRACLVSKRTTTRQRGGAHRPVGSPDRSVESHAHTWLVYSIDRSTFPQLVHPHFNENTNLLDGGADGLHRFDVGDGVRRRGGPGQRRIGRVGHDAAPAPIPIIPIPMAAAAAAPSAGAIAAGAAAAAPESPPEAPKGAGQDAAHFALLGQTGKWMGEGVLG
jgi:hypothetical protein